MGKLEELIEQRFQKSQQVERLNEEIEKIDMQLGLLRNKLTKRLNQAAGRGFDVIKIDSDGLLVVFLSVKDPDKVSDYFNQFGLTVVNQKFDSYGHGWVWLKPEEIAALKITGEEIEL